MFWLSYLPFYELLFGDESQEIGVFGWLLGGTRKPQAIDCLNSAIFPSRLEDPYTINDIVDIKEAKDVITALDLQHLYLYLQPIFGLFLIFMALCTAGITYKRGKPLMQFIASSAQSGLQKCCSDPDNETKLETNYAGFFEELDTSCLQELEKEVVTKARELKSCYHINLKQDYDSMDEMEKQFDKMDQVVFGLNEEAEEDDYENKYLYEEYERLFELMRNSA